MNFEAIMQEAVDLALRGRGEVEPNPRVGAICLEQGRIVGRGWHRYYGGPHAEVEALADARQNNSKPDTVVVTLEPCSSAKGSAGKKTPPCTQALIDAGIKQVIIGSGDPDPRHKGHGITVLENAGIEVADGILASKCRSINRPFERWLGLDRPWTISKYAMTLDGKTAAPTGEARWISGRDSRKKSHALRAMVDGIVVGYGTARIDNPELTVRHVHGDQPVRIVIDPYAELDDDRKLIQTAREVPTWMLVHEDADPVRTTRLAELGVEIIRVKPAENGRRLHLREAWRELRRRGLRRLMVEGGGGLNAQLLAWDCIDQVLAFVAPKMIGGKFAATAVGGDGRPFMAEAWRFDEMYWQASGEDLAIGAFTV